MSNKIKLAEKYSKIANLLDEVGEHEVADACTYIVNKLASDNSFVKEAAGFNLGGLGRSLGNLGKNFLQGGGGGLLGGLMGSLFPGQQQAQGQQPAMNPQLAAAMKNLSALDPTVQSTLINTFTQSVTKAVQEAQTAAQTKKLNLSGVATNAQGQPTGEAGNLPAVSTGTNTMSTSPNANK
jgi:hypothetical protein